jgi:hypothetical protein
MTRFHAIVFGATLTIVVASIGALLTTDPALTVTSVEATAPLLSRPLVAAPEFTVARPAGAATTPPIKPLLARTVPDHAHSRSTRGSFADADVATLRVRASTPGGVTRAGLRLVIEGSPSLFTLLPAPHREWLEDTQDGKLRCTLPLGDKGFVDHVALRRSRTGRLRVEDADGQALWQERWWTLLAESGDPVEVFVEVPTTPIDFTIRVQDRQGRPVQGARVYLDGPFRYGSHETDSDGLLACPDWPTDAIEPRVYKQGFAPLLGETALFPIRDGDRIDLELDVGLSIAVRVQDEQGRSVYVESMHATKHGRSLVASQLTLAPDSAATTLITGRTTQDLELHDLPAGPLELVATLIGGTVRQKHDPSDGDATILVPPYGSLSIRWNEVLPATSSYELEIAEGNGKLHQFFLGRPSDPRFAFHLDHILPGTYSVKLIESGLTGGSYLERTLLEATAVTVTASEHAEAWMHLSPERDETEEFGLSCGGGFWVRPEPWQ